MTGPPPVRRIHFRSALDSAVLPLTPDPDTWFRAGKGSAAFAAPEIDPSHFTSRCCCPPLLLAHPDPDNSPSVWPLFALERERALVAPRPTLTNLFLYFCGRLRPLLRLYDSLFLSVISPRPHALFRFRPSASPTAAFPRSSLLHHYSPSREINLPERGRISLLAQDSSSCCCYLSLLLLLLSSLSCHSPALHLSFSAKPPRASC